MSEPTPGEWVAVGDDRTAYDGFIEVRNRTLRLPDGREVEWDVLGVPPTVTVLPLTPDGRVVVVQQFRVGPMRRVHALPGGLVDPGEEPVAAAVRELREETGYAAGSVELVGTTWQNATTSPRHALVARDCVWDGPQDLDEWEDLTVHLWEVSRLRDALRAGRVGAVDMTYLALDHAGLL